MNQSSRVHRSVTNRASNFSFLESEQPQLFRLGALAERYFPEDPNTCIVKLRQFGEMLARVIAARWAMHRDPDEPQASLIHRLREEGRLDPRVVQLFQMLRIEGNRAAHEAEGDHRTALDLLKMARELAIWFERSFSRPDLKPGAFIPPKAPESVSEITKEELERLRHEIEAQRSQAEKAKLKAEEEAHARLGAETRARQDAEDRAFFEQFAREAEADKIRLAQELANLQAQAAIDSSENAQRWQQAAAQASESIHLDEAATRVLIDQQLRAAGWEVDSTGLRFSQGARPQKGRNLAIAEWPTASGPADYVLFAGLQALAVVEAKRKHKNVASVLSQAERYCRDIQPSPEIQVLGSWEKAKVPFAFSTNGRPYLAQLAELSGIWFRDLRRPQNLSRALQGWYTPEGLLGLLKQDPDEAHAQLKTESFE